MFVVSKKKNETLTSKSILSGKYCIEEHLPMHFSLDHPYDKQRKLDEKTKKMCENSEAIDSSLRVEFTLSISANEHTPESPKRLS